MSRIRGGKRGRTTAQRDREWYPTPAWVIDRLLERLALPEERALSLLDPCSGDGAIPDAVDLARGCRDIWTTIDVRPEARGARTGTHFTGDALELIPRLARHTEEYFAERDGAFTGARWDLAIVNPPFTLAASFLETCLPRCDAIAFLLGQDWYSGPSGRYDLLKRFPLGRQIVIPDRISFDGIGQDQRVYAWFVWYRRDIGRDDVLTTLEMAAQTPRNTIAQWKTTARERIYQHELERAGQVRLHA